MNVIGATNLTIGLLELLIVALIIRESWTLGRGRPPILWAIAAFFVTDALIAVNRSEVLWSHTESLQNATTLDVLGLVILVFVFVHTRRLTHAALATVDLAQYKAAEYERARRDYTQVVRHRVMNPVTVIMGAAETLRCGALTNEELAPKLLDAISESAKAIQNEALMPERRDDLERGLDARPRVDEVGPGG